MKKRLFAVILALLTVVSGLPVEAAETSEEFTAETADEVEAEGSSVLPEISEDIKIAGSNGILYDNIMYLSARTVMALEEDTRSLYYDVCDEIAYYKENGYELEDVVFAVDAEGTLYFSVSIPSKILDDIQEKMMQEMLYITEDVINITAEDADEKNENTQECRIDEDTKEGRESTEEGITEENIDERNENAGDDIAEEDNKSAEEGITEENDESVEEGITEEDDESAEEGITEEDNKSAEEGITGEDNENTEDDIIEENADERNEGTGDNITEETSEEENKSADEESAAEEAAAEEEEQTERPVSERGTEGFTAENLDMLPNFAEETFDVIETVKVDNVIELGYGNENDQVQIKTITPTSGYFYNQLSAEEKKIYSAAKPNFTGGKNFFSYQMRNTGNFNWNPICHAVSAVMLTYPDKTDWMARPGSLRAKGTYQGGGSAINYTISYDKSKYYSGSLNEKAKTQIQTIANAAQQYAAERYPGSPVYGIVQYFDTWICENNYYEMLGALESLKGQPDDVKKIYYYCHSAYGILLNGYGVCESYARAMSRLLDAVGIPNMYVIGDTSSGFHAWNYVQMPNGSWYLVDSTWNDAVDPNQTWSWGTYLLIADDGNHIPTGASWGGERNFDYPSRADKDYVPSTESISFETAVCHLKPKEKETIQVSGWDYIKNAPKTWSSSDTKVAKVDNNGKVTAVAPGKATITLAAAGMTASCEVCVYQVKAVTSANTNKNSDTLSFGISGTQGASEDAKNIVLNVNMGNSPYDAEWVLANGKISYPVITYTNKKVNVATAYVEKIEQNQITLTIIPNAAGTTNIKVAFAGKTATIKVSVGKVLQEDWFAIDKIEGDQISYTGKAIKPKVTKITTEKVTYKVTYLNNKNVGTATVKITGTGKFGGEILYHFEIKPIDITDAVFSKALKDKIYNGGVNAPATTIKLGKKTLRMNTDYTILYNGREREIIPAGTYTISIRGKGNYAGTAALTQLYTVKQNTIAKVTASCPRTVKYTGKAQNPVTVKIGKNVLPESDYTVVYHIGSSKSGKEIRYPLAKGKYTAVITVKGNNLTTTSKKTEIVKRFTMK